MKTKKTIIIKKGDNATLSHRNGKLFLSVNGKEVFVGNWVNCSPKDKKVI
jgi:hypothetical protein